MGKSSDARLCSRGKIDLSRQLPTDGLRPLRASLQQRPGRGNLSWNFHLRDWHSPRYNHLAPQPAFYWFRQDLNTREDHTIDSIPEISPNLITPSLFHAPRFRSFKKRPEIVSVRKVREKTLRYFGAVDPERGARLAAPLFAFTSRSDRHEERHLPVAFELSADPQLNLHPGVCYTAGLRVTNTI